MSWYTHDSTYDTVLALAFGFVVFVGDAAGLGGLRCERARAGLGALCIFG